MTDEFSATGGPPAKNIEVDKAVAGQNEAKGLESSVSADLNRVVINAGQTDPLVITVGMPGSGKSTLLMLMNFAIGATGVFQRLNRDDGNSILGDTATTYRKEVLDEWSAAYTEKHFPNATRTERPIAADFFVKLQPNSQNQGGGEVQPYRIIEVAGERFKTDTLGEPNQASKQFYDFLEEQIRKVDVRKVLLVVVKAGTQAQVESQNMELLPFLTWVAQKRKQGAAGALYPLVVVADPTKAIKDLPSGAPAPDFDIQTGAEFTGEAALYYVKKNFPGVLAQTGLLTASGRPEDVPCFGLFVGSENLSVAPNSAGRINVWHYGHITEILDFVYRSVGGRFRTPRRRGNPGLVSKLIALFVRGETRR